ncbi:hypothetical protein J4Q44_G00278260 [Coregonus suidteri]|uniref:Uncharacterized protein n=1 Tax=Coregonus suidteri TaxID=861788 RepID=A0AAN8QL57_9TELE
MQISRLEELLPVPNFEQAASVLRFVPYVLEECVESSSHPQQLETLLQYHRDLSQVDNHDTLTSFDGDCILSALGLHPVGRVVIATEQTNNNEDMEVHAVNEEETGVVIGPVE